MDSPPQGPGEVTLPGDEASASDWREFAVSLLPDESYIGARNQAITALYARTYLASPKCFKWAGMAAFASHHVRLALLPLRAPTLGSDDSKPKPPSERRKKLIASQTEHIRKTNDLIFGDLYWAHLAYAASEEGFHRLERLLGEEHPIVEGFGIVERGRQLEEDAATEADAEEGRRLVWEGNQTLLRHEQESMVQPQFDKLTPAFAHIFSAISTMNFSAGGPVERARLFCSFYSFMMAGGFWTRQRPPLIPRITHFPDRWKWVSECIVPKFHRFESADDSPIYEQLRAFVEEAPDGYDTVELFSPLDS